MRSIIQRDAQPSFGQNPAANLSLVGHPSKSTSLYLTPAHHIQHSHFPSMAPLLLRKKKQAQAQKPEPKSSPPLRHSLSLPDLTTPLLDPASWEHLPPPASPITPSSPNDQSSSLSPRPRKTSIINHGSPVQFHRPFTPWQVVVNPDSPPQDDRAPGDFRTSRARWGRESTANGQTQMSSLSSMGGLGVGMGETGWKKRAKSKAMGRLNVIIVGSKGVGKTR